MKQFKNHILAALPKADLERLTPHLSPVTLESHTSLMNKRPASYAYFLESGIVSVVLPMSNGATVEVGVIGRDGVVGLPILLGGDGIRGQVFIPVAATAYRVEAQLLKEEFERPGELRHQLEKYLLAHLVQTAQTAACNRLHNIAKRLSRWLLTCRDRLETDQFPLTHEFLAQMLGAPRTTVTLAAGVLQLAGVIDCARGQVTITNRVGLEQAACECYRVVRDEFRRLGLL
jgi:CRP-like cAMP-binding protein